jgi:hypothetical protein
MDINQCCTGLQIIGPTNTLYRIIAVNRNSKREPINIIATSINAPDGATSNMATFEASALKEFQSAYGQPDES